MAETYKILGQIAPAGTAETVLYTSPASTQALITNITVTNRTNSSQTFDINVYDSVKVSNDLIDVSANTFVAVATSSTTAASSTDGITWTERTMPSSDYWSSVAFGNSTFVAVADSSSSATSSTDGITWTLRTLPSSASWKAATYGLPSVQYASPAINNIYKTATILANQSEILEPGITLAAQKTIVARGTSNLTISAYGVELS